MVFTSTGGTRADVSHLQAIRESVLVAATEAGFPNGEWSATVPEVDRALTRAFCNSAAIEVGEGSLPGVWVFFSAVLLADITNWRWGGVAPLERFQAGRRNTFYRYWYRSTILADYSATDPLWLLDAFGEDNLVQIAERPQLAGCSSVIRALARETARALKMPLPIARQRLVRDVMLRANRAGAILALGALDESQAVEFARQTVAQSLQVLREAPRDGK
jgi:hypothetical protein